MNKKSDMMGYSLKLLYEYIKHHPIEFIEQGENKYVFCEKMYCENCNIILMCGTGAVPKLNKNDIAKFKETHPEYFI